MRYLIAAAAVVSCAAAIGVSAYLTQEPPAPPPVLRPAACDDPEGVGVERAGAVAAIFVLSTVVEAAGKRNPECSYDLVGGKLQAGVSRTEWKQHNPVAVFKTDYRDGVESGLVPGTNVTVVYRDASGAVCKPAPDVICLPREVTALLFLTGAYKRSKITELFEVRLVKSGKGEWLVTYWGPITGGGGNGVVPQAG